MDYDPIAIKYADRVNEHPWNLLYERPATMKLMPDLVNLDVLDAGCGNGFYSEYMLRAGARVTSYDLSEKMVEEACKRIGEGCDIFCCETSQLKIVLQEKKFDLILSTMVMHYVDDMESEFRFLGDRLKDNGMLIVSMHHPLLRLDRISKVGYRKVEKVDANWKWVDGRASYFKRPLGVITSAIYNAGLMIEQLVEAEPLPEMAEQAPWAYRLLMKYPGFIHFVLRPRKS